MIHNNIVKSYPEMLSLLDVVGTEGKKEYIAKKDDTTKQPDTTKKPDKPDAESAKDSDTPNPPSALANFGLWQDQHDNGLSCFAAAGPGRIILPPNVDPHDHIILVQTEIKRELQVTIFLVNSNTIEVMPSGNFVSQEAKSLNYMRAFSILSRWASQMKETRTIFPVLDFIKADMKDKIKRMTKKASISQSPKPATLPLSSSTKRAAEFQSISQETQPLKRRRTSGDGEA